MSKNIKNISKAVGNTASVATSTLEVSTGVISDVSEAAVLTIRGAVPFIKDLGEIIGLGITAAALPTGTSVEAVTATYKGTTMKSVMESIKAGTVTTVQELTKDDDDDTDPRDAEIAELKAQLAKLNAA